MQLIPSFAETLLNCTSDTAIDTAETIMDRVTDEFLTNDTNALSAIIKEFPVIKYFVTAGKTMIAVREWFFLKKSMLFFSQLSQGIVDEEALSKRKKAFDNKEKWVYDEVELIISTLDRIDRIEKSKILSELYRAFLNNEFHENQDINTSEFQDLCSVTERLFLEDIKQLRADFDSDEREKECKKQSADGFANMRYEFTELVGRLHALGLMIAKPVTGGLSYETSRRGKKYTLILSRVDFLGIRYK